MAGSGPLSHQKLGDKYVLGELLGQGGFGVVYKARHLLLNRPQAIKVLLEQHFNSSKFRERFIREAQTLAALDHTNILPVHDFGIEGSRAYLVMPFISGGTLQDVLRRQARTLEIDMVWRYLEQICAALDYAHARHVVHLDLKPGNLLAHEDGRLLLADFGLARLMEQGAIDGGTSLQFGSPLYMAPEHFDGKPQQRSDLYALGIILYQMLVSRVPFEGSSPVVVMRMHLSEPPPSLRAARPDLPRALEGVFAKALAKQPEQRYGTAGELLYDFRAALGGQALRFSGPSDPTRLSQKYLDSTKRAMHPPSAPPPQPARPPAGRPGSPMGMTPQAVSPLPPGSPRNYPPAGAGQALRPGRPGKTPGLAATALGIALIILGIYYWFITNPAHHTLGPGLLVIGITIWVLGTYLVLRANRPDRS